MQQSAYHVASPEQAHGMSENAATPATAPAPQPPAPRDYANRMRWLPRIIPLFKREPALAITLSYLLVGAIGLWSSYWYYREFGLPILEYYQVGDFLIAGLRDPLNYMAFLMMLLVGLLAYSVTWYEMRYPDKVVTLRQRKWGRLLFPEYASAFRPRRWYDLSPELVITLGLMLGSGSVMVSHADTRASEIKSGGGTRLRITLAGERLSLQGEARLIGTSTTHIFVYWPSNGRTEIFVHEAVARIERLPRAAPRHAGVPAP